MERLKFRVWDKKEKIFIDHPQINPLFGCVCGYENSTYPLQIEQCTGLKDKNGNLIYEGDIIRFCVKRRGFILTYERIVVWDKDKCGFVVRNAKDQAAPLAKWNMPHPDTHIIEVVGNIHKQAEQDVVNEFKGGEE